MMPRHRRGLQKNMTIRPRRLITANDRRNAWERLVRDCSQSEVTSFIRGNFDGPHGHEADTGIHSIFVVRYVVCLVRTAGGTASDLFRVLDKYFDGRDDEYQRDLRELEEQAKTASMG